LRGSWILDNILGTPPAAPPPNVEGFKENKEGEKARTVRQIMEQHRANPSCNGCHGVMDPLGFSLEGFDAVGAWRTKDRFVRQTHRWHSGQRARRLAQSACEPSRPVCPDAHRKVDDIRPRKKYREL